MYDWNVQTQPDLTEDPAPGSIATIFSPPPNTGMLQWYADRLRRQTSSVHFTAAFGVSQPITAHLATPAPTGHRGVLPALHYAGEPPSPVCRQGQG